MKEKVLYVALPDGAKYQRVIEAEDGKIGIVYTEKPAPPIGGTAVFQIPENGTNYWYSKLKGRDLFMCLQFSDITIDDLLFESNGKKRVFSSYRQKEFKKEALLAIRNKPAEGFRWIPAYEPSLDKNYKIQYVPGKAALTEAGEKEWEKFLKEYSPENGSQQASKTTYFLLLMRWLKDGIATLEQLADHSEEIGHFWNSENAKHTFEKTGERQFGGLYGFVGNTFKQVKDPESPSGLSVLGGSYYDFGNKFPLTVVIPNIYPYNYSIGLLELRR